MTCKTLSVAAALVALTLAGALADTKKPTPPPVEKAKTAAKVKDPICGMMVDPKTAEKATFEGQNYYFCSREERQLFEKNPAKYVKK